MPVVVQLSAERLDQDVSVFRPTAGAAEVDLGEAHDAFVEIHPADAGVDPAVRAGLDHAEGGGGTDRDTAVPFDADAGIDIG